MCMFVINFSFFSIFGTAESFEKSKYGKLLFINNLWTYIIANTKEDFASLIDNSSKLSPSWATNGSIVVEAENLENCLNIFLSYIRYGYIYQGRGINGIDYCKVIGEKFPNYKPILKPILDINFDNWPIKIKEIVVFPDCEYINKKWKEKGILICQEPLVENVLSAVDLCPAGCHSSGLDDGYCLPSAYISTSETKLIKTETTFKNQKFTVIKVRWN